MTAKAAEDFPTLSPADNREQVRLMMRAMLEDRFHLQLYTETREERVYNLEVAKGGLKIKEVDPPVPPAQAALDAVMGDTYGRMMGEKSTMAYLASALTSFLKRPVIDRTGLDGYYDFDVRWSAVETPNSLPPTPGLGRRRHRPPPFQFRKPHRSAPEHRRRSGGILGGRPCRPTQRQLNRRNCG